MFKILTSVHESLLLFAGDLQLILNQGLQLSYCGCRSPTEHLGNQGYQAELCSKVCFASTIFKLQMQFQWCTYSFSSYECSSRLRPQPSLSHCLGITSWSGVLDITVWAYMASPPSVQLDQWSEWFRTFLTEVFGNASTYAQYSAHKEHWGSSTPLPPAALDLLHLHSLLSLFLAGNQSSSYPEFSMSTHHGQQ